MYDLGEGVPEDDVRAYAWISTAAAQGNDRASKATKFIANLMTRAEISEAQKLSREYWGLYGPAHKVN